MARTGLNSNQLKLSYRRKHMKVIKNLKKVYKNMSWYNRQKLMDANCKKSKKKPRQK